MDPSTFVMKICWVCARSFLFSRLARRHVAAEKAFSPFLITEPTEVSDSPPPPQDGVSLLFRSSIVPPTPFSRVEKLYLSRVAKSDFSSLL